MDAAFAVNSGYNDGAAQATGNTDKVTLEPVWTSGNGFTSGSDGQRLLNDKGKEQE